MRRRTKTRTGAAITARPAVGVRGPNSSSAGLPRGKFPAQNRLMSRGSLRGVSPLNSSRHGSALPQREHDRAERLLGAYFFFFFLVAFFFTRSPPSGTISTGPAGRHAREGWEACQEEKSTI